LSDGLASLGRRHDGSLLVLTKLLLLLRLLRLPLLGFAVVDVIVDVQFAADVADRTQQRLQRLDKAKQS